MTGYTVHTGSTKKFSSGWDRIFQEEKPAAGKRKQGTKAKHKTKAAQKKKSGK